MIRRRVRVTGRVQGVGFRYACRRQAVDRGLAGWVTNRDDGSVVAVVEGASDVVAALVEWCRSGPPGARVDTLQVTEEDPVGDRDFVIV